MPSNANQTLERSCQTIFMFFVTIYIAIVTLNNLLDFNSNQLFVQHVLAMDTTFPNNTLKGRALTSPVVIELFYWGIIAWELATTLLCGVGFYRMLRSLRKDDLVFQKSKRLAIAGLAANLMMWFFAFNTVGGEWFLMWQSSQWNGVQTARSMFVVMGILFLYISR